MLHAHPQHLGEYSINWINCLLEEEFWYMVGLERFQYLQPTSMVYHTIDAAELPPLHCKVRPLPDKKLDVAKSAFSEMEAAGKSSAILIPCGQVLYTWFGRRSAPGTPAGTIGCSID